MKPRLPSTRPLSPLFLNRILPLFVVLLAFGLRLWRLADVPPGWRDDELINSLVLSQYILAGDWRPYYPDASGHEALYHALNGVMWWLVGGNVLGIRFLSVLFSTLNVALLYAVGRRMFGRHIALVAALSLAVSFWGLMYGRIGLRHTSLPFFTLIAFYWFWKEIATRDRDRGPRAFPLSLSQNSIFLGVAMGMGFYTYFASRGVPLILVGMGVYTAVVAWPRLRPCLPHLVGGIALALLLAIPLALSIRAQPGGDARVAELAAPVVQAQAGDFALLGEHIQRTLAMFHSDGDDEYLYNIPFRPVFGSIGAIFFWVGVVGAAVMAIRPLVRRWQGGQTAALPELANGFLLLWWLAGLAPGFLSIPAASLGHTILAQPATYLLATLPLGRWGTGEEERKRGREKGRGGNSALSTQHLALLTLSLVLPFSIALRDLPDYFVTWPQRGNVRLLYRADLSDIAHKAQGDPALTDFGVTSLLPGPWDRVALALELGESAVRPRLFNSERVVLYRPSQSFIGYPVTLPLLSAESYQRTGWRTAGGYELATMTEEPPRGNETGTAVACFRNGLCLLSLDYDPATGFLDGVWEVARPLDLPPLPLIANPPPPGVDARPRLSVYAQLLDANGQWLAGDDGLWVDIETMHPGDIFLQRHILLPLADTPWATLKIGLYDPATGERIPTESGADGVQHQR